MKKLLSLIASGALALGLVGCSGDLHDVSLIDLTGYGIIGSMTGWETDTSLLVKNADGSYKFEFTYADDAAFAINKNNDWSTAYRWDGVAGAKNAVKFTESGKSVKVYQGDSPDCMKLPCAKVGDKVTVIIKPTATYLDVTATAKTPEAMYVSIDNTVAAMTPTSTEGQYSYTVDSTGADISFKVFDGTNAYGIATAGAATEETALKKNGETIKILSPVNGAKYLIYVTKATDGSMKVSTCAASYCYRYSIGYVCTNYGNYAVTWTADGTKYKASVTIPAGTANGWGGAATDDIQFGVTDTTSWGTKFTGATLAEASKAYDLTKGAGDNNKITGVNPSAAAVTISLVSSDDKITASYSK